MMKRSRFYLILILGSFIILSVATCKPDSEYKKILIESFKTEAVIEGISLPLDEELFFESFWIIDTLLIVRSGIPPNSFSKDDYIFNIYATSDLKLLGRFGQYGNGPVEFSDPRTDGQFIRMDNTTFMAIYLPNERKILGVDLKKVLNNDKVGVTKVLASLPVDIIGASPISSHITVDGGVIGRSDARQGRFFFLKGDSVIFFPLYPESSRIIPANLVNNLYAGTAMLNPSNDMFVSALVFWKQIDVLSPGLKHRFSLVFPDSPDDPIMMTEQGAPSREVITYFVSLHVSEKYIYALYHGKKLYGQNEEYDSIVFIFSHTGKPIAKLVTKPRISRISVDRDDKVLYGKYFGENGEKGIMRFNLPL